MVPVKPPFGLLSDRELGPHNCNLLLTLLRKYSIQGHPQRIVSSTAAILYAPCNWAWLQLLKQQAAVQADLEQKQQQANDLLRDFRDVEDQVDKVCNSFIKPCTLGACALSLLEFYAFRTSSSSLSTCCCMACCLPWAVYHCCGLTLTTCFIVCN